MVLAPFWKSPVRSVALAVRNRAPPPVWDRRLVCLFTFGELESLECFIQPVNCASQCPGWLTTVQCLPRPCVSKMFRQLL